MSAWDDAFSVVPFVHLPVVQGQRVLAVGPAAKSLAMTALRYPTTVEVVTLGIPTMPGTDPRVRAIGSFQDLPIGWRADLVGIADQTISDRILGAVHQLHNTDTGVAVVAAPSPSSVQRLKDMLRAHWSTIQPYREWTGDATPSWFFLAADHGFKRHRPVPSWPSRLSEKYLPALFTLAKDEYAAAYRGNP